MTKWLVHSFCYPMHLLQCPPKKSSEYNTPPVSRPPAPHSPMKLLGAPVELSDGPKTSLLSQPKSSAKHRITPMPCTATCANPFEICSSGSTGLTRCSCQSKTLRQHSTTVSSGARSLQASIGPFLVPAETPLQA